MPITEVTGPDGRLHHIEHPAGALPSQIIKIAQSQIGPGPSKPGAVSNLFRAGLAGASEVGYDTLQFLADETIKFRAGEEATRAKIEAQYGDQEETLGERLGEIEERKRERLRKSQSIIGDTGRMSGEAFGVEEGRFSADLGRGFGQLVPLVATRGFSAVPMAFMESRRDAEQTFGINYADMDKETQNKVDIAAGTYAMFSYGLNRVSLGAMGLNKLDDFFKGNAKIKGSVVKEIFKGGLKGGGGEFITETIEAAGMDQGFSRIYDPEREFSFSDIKDYLYEGFIGSIVGTTAGTGTSTVKALAGPPQVAVEEEGKPTEEGKPLEVPRSVEVTYKQIDGKVRVVPIAVSKDQDPLTVAEEVLQGRYDKSQGLIINETFEEQPLDIGDQEADILEEDVPVDPVPVEQAPTPEPAPEQAPEGEGMPIPFQRDYRNVKVGDTFEIVGVNGKTKQVEAVGISDQSGMIRFKREDGTFGVTGNEADSVFQDINSPDYALQSAGHGTQGKNIKDLNDAELDDLEASLKQAFKDNPDLKNANGQNNARDHQSDLFAIKLERKRRAGATEGPTPVQPTPAPEPTPGPEIDSSTGLPSFSLPQNLKKGKPGYRQTQNITFASDLERAVYSATTTTTSETGKRKRAQYRKLLEGAGYNSTEINRMGREVRAQMRNQYTGPGSPLIATLPQDIVAQADPAQTEPGSVNLTKKEIEFFDSFLKNKANREELLEEVPSLRIAEGRLFIDSSDVNNLNNFISNVGISDGLGTVPPRLKTSKFYQPFFKSGTEDVVAQADPVQTSVSSVSTAQDSSRVGTARNPKEETSQDSNIDVSMVPEDTLEKHMRIMDYGHLPKDIRNEKNTKVKYEKLVNFIKENLLSLHNAFPDELRARATQWYDGANKIANGFSKRYDITVEQASGILAVLSPQKDWFMNVAQAEQVIHIWRNYQDVRIEGTEYDAMIEEIIDTAEAPIKQKKKKLVNETPQQEKRRQNYNRKLDQKAKDNRRAVLDQIKGKTIRELSQDSSPAGQTVMAWAIRTTAQVQFGRNYSVVTPEGDFGGPSLKMDGQPATNGWGSTGEIVKAVSIIEDGSLQNISDRLGSEHKVRNFYNNIVAPNSPYGDATMDTHAVAAALLMPLGSSAPQVSDNFGAGKAGKTSKSGQTVSGTYYVYLDAYRRAAKEVGLQPRQMQSITWEAIRQVYLPQDRKPEFVKQRTKEWNQYKDEKEARQQIIGETINAPEWAGTSPSGQPGGGATSVQVDGDGSIIGGDLLFRGGSDIIGVPGNSTQITVPAGNRLRLYSGTVSYRSGSSKNSGRSEKTFKGISRVNAKDFVEIASRNKRNHKFGSSVDVFKAKDYKGYHLIVAKGKGRAYVTVAISPSGEVSSVTASKSATKADLNAAFDLAIASGAVRWLNGFDTVLGDIYAFYGFEPVARLPFDTDQAPPDWSYNRYSEFKDGKPDLLFMKFNGQMNRKLSDYPDPGYVPSYNEAVELATEGDDVTAQAAETAAEDRGPQETFNNINQLEDFISKSFSSIADKMGINIYPNMVGRFVAQYNVSQKIIEYNPRALLNRTKAGVQAAMREELIHAAMHNVLIERAKKAKDKRSEDALWVDFFTALGNNLTPQERAEIKAVYQSLQEGNAVAFGSEYSRAVVQKFRYGDFTEQYITPDKGGPAFQAIVDLLRSVQAYMAKVLGPMAKTDPEAAQVIVDTVELLNAIDPSIRPKNQQVVANAYNSVDNNTVEENSEGDGAPKDASQRVREERKWWDGNMRSKLSKGLTPIITRLRRINPQFGLLFQRLENTIRERNLTYKKQAQPFFNKLNSLNSEDFNELKQLLFFSPTPDEANLPKNRATMQRRDALLHKHGLLNMYRLDVQPILEEIYAQYSELGMPIGYLEDYFPRVVKDLEGLIKSYGYETKRTFGNLVRDENARRKEEGLPEMESSERARFFQDFLQNKFSFGPKGVRPPGNVKIREIQTIPPSKLKFYEDPSIAFGSYTTSMVSAIEAYKVLGATNQTGNKGETGELGKLTERLFQEGKIDEQDASELKSIAELATLQASQELAPLRELGAATYIFTLVDVGTVLIQFLDLAKVLVLRGPSATLQGIYRTVTGNRVFDIERDFSIMKKQIMAEFDEQGSTQKVLNFGLRYIVPFQQMDVAMKHVSVEAALIDYLKKANSPVGSKKYKQLMAELSIRMGPEAAFKAVQGFRKDTFDPNSPEVKEALMMELFDRQPLTYLQIPETHRRNPNTRLLYKLKTFMLLDINFNRQLALNDLTGPGKTVEQRYKGLKMLVSMMAALTALGVPKDLLLDFIRGKDTYLSDHVINNMLQVFGLSRYGVGTIFEDGPIDAVVDRFKPAAYSILDGTENDLIAWVKGDREISEFKVWKNAPVFDIWGRFTEDFQDKQKEKFREKRKEGQRPTIRRQ
tara:strand:- start:911 stop:8134 length:7224 start_codon:yes stop_codon:yes gene_type:complete